MVVILHVLIALSSLVWTSLAYVYPSVSKLRIAYGLVALTLASGLYMVGSVPARMVQACTVGLIYVGVVSIGMVAVRSKLTKVTEAKSSH